MNPEWIQPNHKKTDLNSWKRSVFPQYIHYKFYDSKHIYSIQYGFAHWRAEENNSKVLETGKRLHAHYMTTHGQEVLFEDINMWPEVETEALNLSDDFIDQISKDVAGLKDKYFTTCHGWWKEISKDEYNPHDRTYRVKGCNEGEMYAGEEVANTVGEIKDFPRDKITTDEYIIFT